tara:strand:- start:409 stop:660 length:252 start_codon:yes stop_codon:yes gene_type:complete
MRSACCDFKIDEAFQAQCLASVQRFTVNKTSREMWALWMGLGFPQAFLALLLMVLPNVEGLFFGANRLASYPFLFGAAVDPIR